MASNKQLAFMVASADAESPVVVLSLVYTPCEPGIAQLMGRTRSTRELLWMRASTRARCQEASTTQVMSAVGKIECRWKIMN